MTTRDKGITLPGQQPYTNTAYPGGIAVTDVANNYTRSQAWVYGASISFPVNLSPVTLSAPVNFIIQGQNANPSFAAIGGSIIASTGVGTGGNVSGNMVVQDTAGNGGRWNTAHPVLGAGGFGIHLWADAVDRLRIKVGPPVNANDGNVVGWDYVGSMVYDPPNLAAGNRTTQVVACPGAILGDFAFASFSLDIQGLTMTAYVVSANNVTVVLQNGTVGAIDLASGTLKVKVIKQ